MNKISFKKNILNSALASASACLSNNAVIPSLRCFKFKYFVDNDKEYCEICSYNQLNEMKIVIPVIYSDCEDNTEFLVEGDKIVTILKTVTSEDVIIKFDDKKIVFKYDSSQYSKTAECVSDFPEINFEGKEIGVKIQINRNEFISNLKSASQFCEAFQGALSALNGIGIDIYDNSLNICSSDKHRLFYRKMSAVPILSSEMRILVMQNSIKEACALLSVIEDEYIMLSVSNDGRIMSINDMDSKYKFNCTLMELNFPKYQFMIDGISSRQINSIKANSQSLCNALNRIKVISTAFPNSFFKSDEGDNKLVIEYSDELDNSAIENVFFDTNFPKRIDQKFNVSYIMSCIKTFPNKIITLRYGNEENNYPLVILDEDESMDKVCIIMPCV